MQDKIIFADDIPLAKKERKDWEWELYQVRQEGAYNLLALAHILSDLETMARLRYFNDNPSVKPKFPVYLDSSISLEEEESSIDNIVHRLKEPFTKSRTVGLMNVFSRISHHFWWIESNKA